jgi:hypothetical protein
MKNRADGEPDDESVDMRDKYDFRGGVRGKYAERYARGTNVILLDADVAEVFRDAESVNRALRALAGIIREQQAQKPAA